MNHRSLQRGSPDRKANNERAEKSLGISLPSFPLYFDWMGSKSHRWHEGNNNSTHLQNNSNGDRDRMSQTKQKAGWVRGLNSHSVTERGNRSGKVESVVVISPQSMHTETSKRRFPQQSYEFTNLVVVLKQQNRTERLAEIVCCYLTHIHSQKHRADL